MTLFYFHKKYFLFSLFFILYTIFLNAESVKAVGAFATNDVMQAVPLETKVALFHDGKRETLLVSETFAVNPLITSNFFWLIPVPAKPEVEIMRSDFFAHIEMMLDPNVSPSTSKTRATNLRYYIVFEPGNGVEPIKQYLSEKGIFLPKRQIPVLEQYFKEGWYVVAVFIDASHIQRDASESITLDTVHTYPVKLSFEADKALIPWKLGSIEPDIDFIDATLPYDASARQVIGIDDEQIDALLSYQSPNLYPQLPLGGMNVKMDAFIFSEGNPVIPGFDAINQIAIDGEKFGKSSWNAFFLDLPSKNLTLTHVSAYKHLEDMDDIAVEIEKPRSIFKSGSALVSSAFAGSAFSVTFLLIFAAFLIGFFAARYAHTYAFLFSKLRIRGVNEKKIFIVFLLSLVIGMYVLIKEKDTNDSFKKLAGAPRDNLNPASFEEAGMQMDMSSRGVRKIFVQSGDFFFSPQAITLNVGQRVEIHIKSQGGHTFTVPDFGIDVETPDNEITIVEFIPTRKGIFDFVCTIPGHEKAGQKGTMIVE